MLPSCRLCIDVSSMLQVRAAALMEMLVEDADVRLVDALCTALQALF